MMAALYNDYSSYMRRVFGCKVQKVSVDASFTCPNRDGTVGWGGCTYCNNASFSPSYCRRERSVACQVRDGVAFFARKYPQMKYLAYFQSYTSTYGRLDDLMRKYEEALSVDGVVGIVIGTRPDCMPDVLLSYLSRLSRQTYVMVEYGIESTDDAMLRHINRGHDFAVVRDAVARTAGAGVAVGGHIILGLPGDTAESIMRQPAILSGLPLTCTSCRSSVAHGWRPSMQQPRDVLHCLMSMTMWMLSSPISRGCGPRWCLTVSSRNLHASFWSLPTGD